MSPVRSRLPAPLLPLAPRWGFRDVEVVLHAAAESARLFAPREPCHGGVVVLGSPMTLAAGTRLGPYEILAPIGAGGMGEVYRARDERLKREVAVKVLPASFSMDPDRLRRFEQEAQAAGALNHPNITAVYDIGQHDGAPYIVSELLEGETLRSRLVMGALSAPQGHRVCRPDRSGPRRSARERDRAPRLEAREPLRDERWPPEDPRLRSRQVRDASIRRAWPVHSGYRRRHETRSHRRHDGLHVARAGSRHGRRSQIRHLFLRRDSVRDALRAAGFPATQRHRDAHGHSQGGAAATGAGQRVRDARACRHRRPLSRKEPRRAVPVGP